MDFAAAVLLQFASGTLAAVLLARLWPPLQLRWPGLPTVGGLGGVMLGELKGHLMGGHHHVAGMVMPSPLEPGSLFTNLVAGGAGGGLLLLTAYVICRLVP